MQADNSQVSRRNLFAAAAGLAAGNILPQPAFAAGDKAVFKIKTYGGVEGEVEVQLFADKAPKTVEAFKALASEGFYDGTAFHRVASFLKKSVLIGGDPFTKEEPYCITSSNNFKGAEVCSEGAGYGKDGFFTSRLANSNDDSKKTRGLWDKGGPAGWRRDSLSKYKLTPEFNTIPHERGVITMRRFYAPDSAGSQFIFCLSDMTKELDGHYAAFGKVTKGIELLDKISEVETFKSPSPLQFLRDDKVQPAVWGAWDLPVQRQGIEKVTIQ